MSSDQAASKEKKERPIPEPPSTPGGIIDSHAHVVEEYFSGETGLIIERAKSSGVKQMVNPAVTLDGIKELTEIIDTHDFIYAAAGQHPHEAKHWDKSSGQKVEAAMQHAKFVAVGECGLDYHYNNSSREEQLKCFADQIELAVALNKPVIVHCRDAWEDAFDLLTRHGQGKVRGVFHCFTGGPEHLEAIARLDFYVSFSGIVTYKKAESIQQAAPLVNANRFLVETDCPFLSPQKVRGLRNEPSFVWWTAQKLAELRATTIETIGEQASANARALFCLPNLN
ncbi:MAG: TatD family hydrolase [Candidatus Obscuribacter sp.]|nr:TatD family hydrolase [Candidatus Obscuribacter sp.]